MNKITPSHLLFTILLSAMLLIMIMGMVGCASVSKAKQTLDSSPMEAAKYCAEKFPVKDTVIYKDTVSYDTLYIKGETIYNTNYETINDTVVKTITKTLPANTIVKTVTQVKEVIRENTARVKQLELSLIACNNEYSNLIKEYEVVKQSDKLHKKQRNKWRLYFFLLLGSVVLWKFRKPLLRLV